MNCWICGQPADSREHRVKASDIRAVFGKVDAGRPLYLHSEVRKNRRVASAKSKVLKHEPTICQHCNNVRTQPYDRAWESLSAFLADRAAAARKGTRVRLDRVFPGSVHQSMLEVHLFFAKLFGCIIVEDSIPIATDRFAQAITTGTAHPHLFLGFWSCLGLPQKRQVGVTPVKVVNVRGRSVFAGWFYDAGRVAVSVMYAEPSAQRGGLEGTWHPDTGTKVLRLNGW